MVGNNINDSPALIIIDIKIIINFNLDIIISNIKFMLILSNLYFFLIFIIFSYIIFQRIKFNFI
jgi:cation transport ATPase